MANGKEVEITIPSIPPEEWKEITIDFRGLSLQELCNYCYKIGWIAGKQDEMKHTKEFLQSLTPYGKDKIRRTGSRCSQKKVSKNTARRKHTKRKQ